MKIYDYWARVGARVNSPYENIWWVHKWGGSNVSLDDAKAIAKKYIADLSERFSNDEQSAEFYYGTEGPILEKVMERFGPHEKPYAAITRNRYGALILNAPNVFFADVDVYCTVRVPKEIIPNQDILNPKPQSYRTSSGEIETGISEQQLKTHKLHKAQVEKNTEEREAALLKEKSEKHERLFHLFKSFQQSHPSISLRVYETAAGFRLVVTSKTVDVTSEEPFSWLQQLNSDKLYIKLCQKQQCFRARLTPKPWRLAGVKTPCFFPNGQYEEEYDQVNWLEQYESKSKSFAVCKLVATYGDSAMDEEVEKVLKVHDKYVLNEYLTELA